MTLDGPGQRRWVEDEPEEAAAKLLYQVRPPPLSTVQLARVKARLDASVQAPRPVPTPWTWLLPSTAALALGVVLGFFAHARFQSAPPPSSPSRSAVALPAPLAPAASAAGLVLLGPGEVWTGSGGPPTLRSGALLVRTTESPMLLATRSAQLTVSPHSMAEVVSAFGDSPLVAAYLGSVAVRWFASDRALLVPAGHAATSAGPVELPVGRAQRLAAHPWGNNSADPPQVESLDVELSTAARRTPPRSKAAAAETPDSGRPRPDRQTATPAEPAAAPPLGEVQNEDNLHTEAQLLDDAMARLRSAHDAAGALSLLDSYRTRFPQGRLQPEAAWLRINVLLALERKKEALAALNSQALTKDTPRAMELRVMRGELRAAAEHCEDAIADFDAVLEQVEGELQERALYGRSRCRARSGELGGARNDLALYLRRFPHGRFSASARQLFLSGR